MGSIDTVAAPHKDQVDQEACLYALQLASASILPMTLKAAIELDVLEILVKGCGSPSGEPVMTATDVASHLETDNPEVTITLFFYLHVYSKFLFKCHNYFYSKFIIYFLI